MFVVPDTVDMTKVCNLEGVGDYWEIGSRKIIQLTFLIT